MITNNICFRREIRKILCGYPLLSVPVTMKIIIKIIDKLGIDQMETNPEPNQTL